MTDVVKKSDLFITPSPTKHFGGIAFFIAVIVFIAWLLNAALSWMTDTNRMPLSQLVIQGELKHLTTDDVRQAILQLDHLGTFMTQDIGELQGALESLPWVAHASVRKQWPETVKVYLLEHQPAAIWNQSHLVNEHGDVFYADASQVADLPLVKLVGPEGSSPRVFAALNEMQPRLQLAGFEIDTLILNERRAWRVELTNGIRLEIGRKMRMERLERFINLFPELEAQGKAIAYIDLRYDIGVAVGWKTVPEE
ncbi:cell division protein FtsQ [Photobacterium jeanii]|uniref:Cell division protein FtsQ n=1 Tax=Photobacterium jeanii TaxID=858640 RepID=A0A178KIJ5_9GAMM|nr:cell division protein FtsQ/DivIB [Photobacterium jeanii]OAN16573.1 cell division protein FtsQ [Photobacterium jeanii]PST87966.1 cell division protein FtsQ [Photobacterium jeanii]